MRYLPALIAACLMAGCSSSPPKPPLPKGEYQPINIPARAKLDVFDFFYEGDILGALPALAKVAPGVDVLPSIGQASPLPVRLQLRGANLDEALRAIGAQGAGIADVVVNSTRSKSVHQVFIRFRTPVVSADNK